LRILVTGGAGYVGSVLSRKLIKLGHEVIIWDKLLFSSPLIEDWLKGSTIVTKDLLDISEAASFLPIDCCCHLAAVSNDPSAELDKTTTELINVMGTMAVANFCSTNGIPLIVASTASVYGFIEWELCKESGKLNPQSFYGESKVKMEKRLIELHNRTPEWPLLIFRKATIFGWSPRMRYDLVVNTMVKDAFSTGRIRVHGGGECWRPLVYVGDVADAYIRGIDLVRQGFSFDIVNLVHKNYRISELASWLAYVLRDRMHIFIDVFHDQPKDTRGYAISNEKANALGFNCPTGVSDAANELWAKLESGITADIDNPIYYNHKWLQLLREVRTRIDSCNWDSIP